MLMVLQLLYNASCHGGSQHHFFSPEFPMCVEISTTTWLLGRNILEGWLFEYSGIPYPTLAFGIDNVLKMVRCAFMWLWAKLQFPVLEHAKLAKFAHTRWFADAFCFHMRLTIIYSDPEIFSLWICSSTHSSNIFHLHSVSRNILTVHSFKQ